MSLGRGPGRLVCRLRRLCGGPEVRVETAGAAGLRQPAAPTQLPGRTDYVSNRTRSETTCLRPRARSAALRTGAAFVLACFEVPRALGGPDLSPGYRLR
jgi:hypothetical protein